MKRADILAFYARYERSRIRLRSRLTYWWRDQPVKKAKARFCRVLWLAKQWLVGAPYADGGPTDKLKPDDLQNFHDLEKNGILSWRWSRPEASVRLAVSRKSHRIRIETGSPEPMMGLKSANVRFFINGHPLPDDLLSISGGTVEIDLPASLLAEGPSQVLGWKMDRLPVAAEEERPLGMPVAALWVFRGTRNKAVA
jgi:hypothetical protein